MKIAKNLNLIIPVRTEKGNGWIHATPISKEVFKEHFFILGKTFSAMFSDGLGKYVNGPDFNNDLNNFAENVAKVTKALRGFVG
ncbi:hypothetical protein MZH04_26660, partial [Escherichia coli]|nr:hypothetical protein [Escherichia coli]